MSRSDPVAKLWEWLIGAILVLVFVPAIVSMLLRAILLVLSEALGSLLGAVVIGLVGYGLFARAFRSRLTDARLERERRAEERFIRQSVRQSASDVPLREQAKTADEDPALNTFENGEEQ